MTRETRGELEVVADRLENFYDSLANLIYIIEASRDEADRGEETAETIELNAVYEYMVNIQNDTGRAWRHIEEAINAGRRGEK